MRYSLALSVATSFGVFWFCVLINFSTVWVVLGTWLLFFRNRIMLYLVFESAHAMK